MTGPQFVPWPFKRLSLDEMKHRAAEFLREASARRTVRDFSPDDVPRELIEAAIRAAGSAPSGANRQPWQFVAVSDPAVKREIRIAAEAEERESYANRMPEDWKEAITPMGTTWEKPFLETVPWVVAVFAEQSGRNDDGSVKRNWYVSESVGMACGIFVAALHHMGLASLTHTPSPMKFLNRILNRPVNEKPYVLYPIGYPAEGVRVPDIERKRLEEIATWFVKKTGEERKG